MLESSAKIISSILTCIGFTYVISKIIDYKFKKNNLINTIYLLIPIVFQIFFLKEEYKSFYTITYYLVSIITYKKLFKLNMTEAIASTSIMMIVTFIIDTIDSLIFLPFLSINTLRKPGIMMIVGNLTFLVLCNIVMRIKIFKKIFIYLYNKLVEHQNITSLWFFVLLVIVFTIIEYSLFKTYGPNINFVKSLFLILIFGTMLVIYLKEKNKNDKIVAEYDNLFNYVQNFEDWIEKEQLNRHEFKNQLAVLRCMAKSEEVIKKIDSILEDNINIEGEIVNSLKALPKGGIKGLMYYKAAIAQKKKINLSVDVSLDLNGILDSLTEDNKKVICKLIGIYFDNAIEAALETKKKQVSIEIYEISNHVSFTISNTFKRHKNMKNRNEKGVSTKGEGHGNGLYFASKLIDKNKWLSQKQDILSDIYTQYLYIEKPDTNK